jgi:AraC-like DNA-binding protein
MGSISGPDAANRVSGPARPNRAQFMRRNLRPVEAGSDAPSFSGTLDFAHVGPMRIGRFATDRRCELRHPVAVTLDAPSYLMVAVQLRGRSVYVQHGRTMQLEPGSWGACDVPQPCLSVHQEGVEQLHFLIPRELIRMAIDVRSFFGRSFGESPVSTLMCQTIRSLFEQLPSLDPRRAEELADVAQRLFHIAAMERIEQPRPLSMHEEMRDRICGYIEDSLRDPRLTLDLIAHDLNCTKRYLHMVFAGQEQTLSEYIWARRLERSRADLENPALRERPITEIAMSWGFNNLSHFSRAFRDRFGMSPRAARSGRDAGVVAGDV